MAEQHRVATLAELGEGEMKRVVVAGRAVALYRVGGMVYATDDTCTHAEASLTEGELEGEVVTCPRHGARFDVRTGRALTLPAFRPLRTYPVRVEGEEVWITL